MTDAGVLVTLPRFTTAFVCIRCVAEYFQLLAPRRGSTSYEKQKRLFNGSGLCRYYLSPSRL